MTAFETAWGIVKMPVVPNQLEYLGENPNAGSFYTDTKRFKTLFQDPETQELLPLFVDYGSFLNREGKKYESYKGAIGADPNSKEGKLRYNDEGDTTANAEGRLVPVIPDLRRAITGVNFNQGAESRFPHWSETREGFRNRGYASALYDVIAHLMDKQGGHALNPSHEQKAAAKGMWKNRKTWPVRDDL
jgi:hypothetical protein